MNIDDFMKVFWHDGLLDGASIIKDQVNQKLNQVKIFLQLYLDENDSARTSIVLIASSVTRSTMVYDFVDLNKNAFAGNINHGFIENISDGKFRIFVSLVNGIVEIICDEILVDIRE